MRVYTSKLTPDSVVTYLFHATSELVLRVHYKSVKCDASFSQGSVSTVFR